MVSNVSILLYGAIMASPHKDHESTAARSIRDRRLHRGWTQTDVAREMRDRGFPFHQQTIQRIEDGQRPIRLNEAYAFAEIFSVELTWLTTSDRGLRQRSIYNAVEAVVEVLSGLSISEDAAWAKLTSLRGHVRDDLADDPMHKRTEGEDLAVAILERFVAPLERLRADALKGFSDDLLAFVGSLLPPEGAHILTADDLRNLEPEEIEEGEFDAEQDIRSALAKVKPRQRHRTMPLAKLVELYVGTDD